MSRPLSWLLCCCLLIFAGLFLFSPQPIPILKEQYSIVGVESLTEGQPYRAIAFFERVLAYDSNQPQVRENIGLAYIAAGDVNNGYLILEGLQVNNQLSDEGRLALGNLALKYEEPQKAEAYWIKIRSGSEQYLLAQEALNNLYIEQERWQDLARLLEKLSQTTGDNKYHQRAVYSKIFENPAGLSFMIQANPGEIADDLANLFKPFDKADTSTNAQIATAWIQAGDYFFNQDEQALAVKAYLRAEKIAPASGIPAAKLALMRVFPKEDQQNFAARAIQIEPGNPQVNELVGYYWMNSARPDIALIYLVKADQLKPGNSQVLTSLSRVELELGNLEQSLLYLEKNAILSPGDPNGWRLMARFCLDHQYQLRERGLEAIRKAVLANEKDVESLDLAGQIYWELGDSLTASDFFQRAIEIDAGYPPAQIHYGMWLIQIGEGLKAKSMIESAIRNSTDPALRQQAMELLAQIY